MEKQTRQAGALTRLGPAVQMVMNRTAPRSVKYVRVVLRLSGKLCLQPAFHVAIDRQRARLFALGLTDCQPDDPRLKIDLVKSDAAQLVFARAGMIAAHQECLEVRRHFFQKSLVLLLLDETLARV